MSQGGLCEMLINATNAMLELRLKIEHEELGNTFLFILGPVNLKFLFRVLYQNINHRPKENWGLSFKNL